LEKALARDVVDGRIVERGRAGADDEVARDVLPPGERSDWRALGGCGIAGLALALILVIGFGGWFGVILGETMLPAERRRLSMCDIPNPELAVGVVTEGEG
jgi:hypothetical protein